MNLWQAFFLGIVQGVTEFLPVSSSGHLAISQQFLNISEPTLVFDVFLHAVSLIVIIKFFWKRILQINFKELTYLAIATIPAILVGLFLETKIDAVFNNLSLIGLALITTGLINLTSNHLLHESPNPKNLLTKVAKVFKKKSKKLTISKAATIGVFQSFALVPGISRSGATLLGSLTQNLDREESFNFTFLLAIPAIAGATLLQTFKLFNGTVETVAPSMFLIGGIGAFVASFYSLSLFKKLITEAKLSAFGWYCLIAGGSLVIAYL